MLRLILVNLSGVISSLLVAKVDEGHKYLSLGFAFDDCKERNQLNSELRTDFPLLPHHIGKCFTGALNNMQTTWFIRKRSCFKACIADC